MERDTLATVDHPGGVYPLPASRVAALLNLGMVPDLPDAIDLFTRIANEAPPEGVLAKALWYAIGDSFAPRGLIGFEVRFNPNLSRWTLEIWEVRGKSYFVIRTLLRHVAAIARENGYVMTGETPIENYRFFGWASRVLGGSVHRNVTHVRAAWDFK